jgi:tRNA G18 (ribose-2'-O)-methylase SpoU
VKVPMAPGVDSINVATSLAVVAAFAGARRDWG